MSMPLVLTVDVGTGSARACVYDTSQHKTLAVAATQARIHHPHPHHAEWDTDVWFAAILQAIRQAVTSAGRPAGEYLGMTVTSLRQAFVLLDEKNEAVAPGVFNYDRRGAETIPLIAQTIPTAELYTLTGHWHAPELTLPKLLWFREKQPEVWRRVRRFCFVHDWLLLQLTGQWATSPSLIAAGQMADCARRTWAQALLSALDIPMHILPPVQESGTCVGGMVAEVAAATDLYAGLPVMVGGGDTQFGCLGVGGMESGVAVIVGGSTTPIMMTAAQPLFDELRYPWVSPHLHPELWAIETNAGHTGMLYKWLRDKFGAAQAQLENRDPYEMLNELVAATPIGADDLLVVATNPRWAEDTWQHKAPYVIYDFNMSHSLGHIGRAIMEGVCYGVRGNLEQLERVAGERFARVLFTGGAARVPFWAQMMADVLGRTILVPHVPEPAAPAGAQIVLKGVGVTTEFPPPDTRSYHPRPDNSQRYEPYYLHYLEVFGKMQQTFAEGGAER